MTNCTVYIVGYNFQYEEILYCYSYPLKTITSVIRDVCVTSKATIFSSQKQMESLRLINKFLIGSMILVNKNKEQFLVEKFFIFGHPLKSGHL